MLAAPGARSLVAFGLIGRAPMSMLPLAFVFAVVDLTGSYGLGGAAAAAYTLTGAAVGPWLGRRVDVHGQRRVGRLLVAAFAVATAATASLVALAGPAWLLVPLAGLAGACQPNLGAWTRTRWTVLLSEPRVRDTAQAVESIVDELNFLVGPSAIALLSAAGPAWLTLAAPAVLGVIGSVGVLSLRRSEPPPHGGRGHDHDGVGLHDGRAPAPGFWPFLAALAGIGVALGGMTVVMASVTRTTGDAGYAAVVFALYSLASLVGGIVVGRVAFRGPARTRFARSLVIYGLSVLPIAVAEGGVGFAAASFVAGAIIAPTFIQANAHVAEVVASGRRTEAFAWVGAAVGLGLALGSALLGRVVDLAGVDGARAAIVVVAFFPALIALAWGARRPAAVAVDA